MRSATSALRTRATRQTALPRPKIFPEKLSGPQTINNHTAFMRTCHSSRRIILTHISVPSMPSSSKWYPPPYSSQTHLLCSSLYLVLPKVTWHYTCSVASRYVSSCSVAYRYVSSSSVASRYVSSCSVASRYVTQQCRLSVCVKQQCRLSICVKLQCRLTVRVTQQCRLSLCVKLQSRT